MTHFSKRLVHALPFTLTNSIANLFIIGLWLALFRPVYGYLRDIFMTHEAFRTNQLVLWLVLAAWVWRMWRSQARLSINAPLQANTLAWLLCIGGVLAFIFAERLLNVHILSACAFGVATYGLLGLWMQPQRWRAGLPAALLLVGALPFGDFLQVFVGYPMRFATAEIVRHGFAQFGFNALGTETILVFENGISHIDLPCSGVKSLWTGSLFLIAITWLENKPIRLRWLGVAACFGVSLFVFNTLRVAILIGLGQVLGNTLAASLWHVPLGVLGFVAVCGVAFAGIHSIPSLAPQTQLPAAQPQQRSSYFAFALMACLIIANLFYQPRPTLAAPTTQSEIFAFPSGLKTSHLELRPGELQWLTDDGAEEVERARFEWRGLRGSLLLVQSRTWRAHHKPERCFINYGFRIQAEQTQLIASQPVKQLHLNNTVLGKRTAMYWFQSASQTTDDYSARLWDALSLHPQRWMLVTILFDGQGELANNDDDAQSLVRELHTAVHTHLQK